MHRGGGRTPDADSVPRARAVQGWLGRPGDEAALSISGAIGGIAAQPAKKLEVWNAEPAPRQGGEQDIVPARQLVCLVAFRPGVALGRQDNLWDCAFCNIGYPTEHTASDHARRNRIMTACAAARCPPFRISDTSRTAPNR